MAAKVPAKKNTAFTFYTSLTSQATPNTFQSSPTLAVGDVKVSQDGGGFSNLGTLPTASGKLVTVTLTSGEMNGDEIEILFSDAAGAEWCDKLVRIPTTARQID